VITRINVRDLCPTQRSGVRMATTSTTTILATSAHGVYEAPRTSSHTHTRGRHCSAASTQLGTPIYTS
jgi:hypothetical protein